MKGILLVDKPPKLTSHDVVDRIRRASGIRRVGHTGTLDPGATGLLVMCLGPATRLSEYLTGMDKVYEGSMQLGVVTDSYDLDGKIEEENEIPALDKSTIEGYFKSMTGNIMQVPPMVSAVKIGGERLYKKARKGEIVERPARSVQVSEFRLVELSLPYVHFVIRCGSGTYVRSLCHDVGQLCGCGAVLATLRRTHVGEYSVADSASLDELKEPCDVEPRLLPLDTALNFPSVTVDDDKRQLVATGSKLYLTSVEAGILENESLVQLKAVSGELLAVATVHCDTSGNQSAIELQPKKVFCAIS